MRDGKRVLFFAALFNRFKNPNASMSGMPSALIESNGAPLLQYKANSYSPVTVIGVLNPPTNCFPLPLYRKADSSM